MSPKSFLRISALAVCLLGPASALAQLPRDPSELLLIGDSVAAGMYFLELEQESIDQSWTGQLLRRLGMEVPAAPFHHPYPIDHLKLARDGFGRFRIAYAWEARRALYPGKSTIDREEERVVLAIPGQTVGEVLEQSSKNGKLNEHSAGWTFARIMLPDDRSAIETVEHWQKRPRWIVVFIGANDLLASFGIVGAATPPDPAMFRAQYAELVDRLRAVMSPGAPAAQLIVATLPDVTALPFLQELPASADNGDGVRYPAGSKASTFLLPYRSHFQDDEVWTPDELETIRHRARDYNAAIIDIANARGLTVVDMAAVSRHMARDSTFSSAASPYFSPDLHHPSWRTHRIMANTMLETMASIAGEAVPDTLARPAQPLPAANELKNERRRVNALMHLGIQGTKIGPLPRKFTARLSFEAGAQIGDERVGDAVFVAMAGVEGLPVPVSTQHLLRICAHVRTTAVALHSPDDDTDLFPSRGLEGRLGLGFEKIGAWNWSRFELGGLITPDDSVDFGVYARQEWRMVYIEAASRGWLFDRLEVGLRFGRLWARPGRNGN
ncbi:MAG TPA: GDSL-type esterase/lipase family protein [Candidatus Krumholzibacteria bacterium]